MRRITFFRKGPLSKNAGRLLLVFFLFGGWASGQEAFENRLLPAEDLQYLKGLTESVLESSRIYPGQQVVDRFGPNNTGGVLIRPGGRRAYPSFWIRDYAMSLASGLVPADEQLHMLRLTAETQCDQTWISPKGTMIPLGAIADHVRIDDGLPVYFPGTYSHEQQASPKFGMMPPYGDQFLFVHMAWQYVQQTGDESVLMAEMKGMKLIDRLELAFRVPPAGQDGLVYTTEDFRGVDFGFRDAEVITGYLCFTSVLKVRAAREMASLYERMGQWAKARPYREMAETIRQAIPGVFMDERGILLASTEKSRQGDVWSTALAVYLNALPLEAQARAATALAEAYRAGTLAYKGNIRHVLTSDDFSETTAWEFAINSKNKYQNGSYWGTPTGWVAYAIARVDPESARQLVKAYIDDLRETDYRQGEEFGGPYECFHPETGDLRNPVYLTTVSCPYAVFKQFELPAMQFEKERLHLGFVSEGSAVADVNRDGLPDIMAGSFWFEAPDWKRHEFRSPLHFDPAAEWSDAFLHFATDVDEDGWTDLIRIGFPGQEGVWYRNPQGREGHWQEHPIDPNVCNESPLLADLNGDGKEELVFGRQKPGEMARFQFEDGQWTRNVIAGPKAPGTHRFSHGLGTGDLNQDGRPDVLVKQGWWEQPAEASGPWTFHAVDFGPDCAQMYVYDFDADGDQDVLASSAHNYGLWWCEQIGQGDSTVWRRHLIHDQFSQTHGLALSDLDGDDLPDLVTGKRYFAHNGKDPGGKEQAVLYAFLLRRDEQQKPYWVPVLIDDDSGVGLQVLAVDVDQDGKMDVVSANKKGVFIFRQGSR
jgi:hypothetical protein